MTRPKLNLKDKAQKALEGAPLPGNIDAWLRSSNPIKKRVAQLERAFYNGITRISNDMLAMFQNFELVADAHDATEVNLAAVNELLIEKGVFTNEEFQEKRQKFIRVLNEYREKAKRAAELEAQGVTSAEKEDVLEAETTAADGSKVDAELISMRRKVIATDEQDHFPPEATIFGG